MRTLSPQRKPRLIISLVPNYPYDNTQIQNIHNNLVSPNKFHNKQNNLQADEHIQQMIYQPEQNSSTNNNQHNNLNHSAIHKIQPLNLSTDTHDNNVSLANNTTQQNVLRNKILLNGIQGDNSGAQNSPMSGPQQGSAIDQGSVGNSAEISKDIKLSTPQIAITQPLQKITISDNQNNQLNMKNNNNNTSNV